MKIVFFTSYYEHYLENFYKRTPSFNGKPYEEQFKELTNDYYGVFGSYAKYVNRLNAEAKLIVCNCKPMQRMWAKENNVPFDEKTWRFTIPLEQIKRYKPDIFFISSMFEYYGGFLDEARRYVRNIFGWISCPVPSGIRLSQVDLILTSVPKFVEDFREQGVNSELLLQAFDPEIFDKLSNKQERKIDFSFIGNFTRNHSKRIELVQKLIEKTSLKIFGAGIELIPDNRSLLRRMFSKKPVYKRYCGEVWGLNMYRTLLQSKVTFNSHIDVSGNFAGNMRMYEATGMGTLLLTDGQDSENRVFSENEVVYYNSIDDAIDKVNHYLEYEEERNTIAKKGQERTFKDYNYEKNTQSLYNYFLKYIK